MSRSFRQKFLKYGAIGAMAGMIFFVYLLFTSYVGFSPVCRIAIGDDMVSGNRSAIISAIKMLKREEKEAYQTLCKYVDQIIEHDCLAVEPRVDPSWRGLNAEGCYIRGSKTIYLKPEKSGDAASVLRRSRALLRYAKFSKEFWDGRVK